MSVMYIRNEQTGEFEPVPSLVGPQGPPGANGGGAGTTASRPTAGISAGYQYFDTTLKKPVWYTGSGWVDATGTTA